MSKTKSAMVFAVMDDLASRGWTWQSLERFRDNTWCFMADCENGEEIVDSIVTGGDSAIEVMRAAWKRAEEIETGR